MSFFQRKPKGHPAASPLRARFAVTVAEHLDANPAVTRVATDAPSNCGIAHAIVTIAGTAPASTLLGERWLTKSGKIVVGEK